MENNNSNVNYITHNQDYMDSSIIKIPQTQHSPLDFDRISSNSPVISAIKKDQIDDKLEKEAKDLLKRELKKHRDDEQDKHLTREELLTIGANLQSFKPNSKNYDGKMRIADDDDDGWKISSDKLNSENTYKDLTGGPLDKTFPASPLPTGWSFFDVFILPTYPYVLKFRLF